MLSTISNIHSIIPFPPRSNVQKNKEINNVFNTNGNIQGDFQIQGKIREFGKDITNSNSLTENQQQEYLKSHIIKKTNNSNLKKKFDNLERKEEDITNKLKKYEINYKKHIYKKEKSLTSNALQCQKKINNNLHNSVTLDSKDFCGLGEIIINNEIVSNALNENKGDIESTMEIEEARAKEYESEYESDNDNKMIIDDIKTDIINIQEVDEYFDDIYMHLNESESAFRASPLYMSTQTDINEKMRAILLDWLVEVHLKYKMVPETLFLTVNIIDRYLEKNITMRSKLQLVGVAAMMIATKYEDIFPPEVKNFSYITDNAYNVEEIKEMEAKILSCLEYNVTVVSVYRILECYRKKMNLDELTFHFAWYLCELCLIEYKMLKYKYSEIAASACLIALKMIKIGESFLVSEYTSYSEEDLKGCSRDICLIVHNLKKSNLVAVRKKFSLDKFYKVAKIDTKLI